jgi:hypothetical protein
MMNLIIPKNLQCCGWNRTLINRIKASGLFQISEGDHLPTHITIKTRRNGWFSYIQINDMLIGIDSWDTLRPTITLASNFGKEIPKPQVIFKIQYKPKVWDKFERETGIKVRPFSMFPSSDFPLGTFQWTNSPKKYKCSVSGTYRSGRDKWASALGKYPEYHIKNGKQPMASYIDVLKNCQYGLILAGLHGGGDVKNRREVEFSSVGLPLVLNYTPSYPFPFVDGVHYLRVRKAKDLIGLDANWEELSRQSSFIYNSYFSEKGLAELLIKQITNL